MGMVLRPPMESRYARLGGVNASPRSRLGLSRGISDRLCCINLTCHPRKRANHSAEKVNIVARQRISTNLNAKVSIFLL